MGCTHSHESYSVLHVVLVNECVAEIRILTNQIKAKCTGFFGLVPFSNYVLQLTL